MVAVVTVIVNILNKINRENNSPAERRHIPCRSQYGQRTEPDQMTSGCSDAVVTSCLSHYRRHQHCCELCAASEAASAVNRWSPVPLPRIEALYMCSIVIISTLPFDSHSERGFIIYYAPDFHREGHYEMMTGVCLSICLSVACLDLTRQRKGLEA